MKGLLAFRGMLQEKAPEWARVLWCRAIAVCAGGTANRSAWDFCVCPVLGPESEHFFGGRGRQLVVVALELHQLVVRSGPPEDIVLQQGPQGGPGYVCDLAGDEQWLVAPIVQHLPDHVDGSIAKRRKRGDGGRILMPLCKSQQRDLVELAFFMHQAHK